MDRDCGKDRWPGSTKTLKPDISRVSDAKLWQFRIDASTSLVEYARERLSLDLAAAGAPPEEVEVQSISLILTPSRWALRAASRPTRDRTYCCMTRSDCFAC